MNPTDCLQWKEKPEIYFILLNLCVQCLSNITLKLITVI